MPNATAAAPGIQVNKNSSAFFRVNGAPRSVGIMARASILADGSIHADLKIFDRSIRVRNDRITVDKMNANRHGRFHAARSADVVTSHFQPPYLGYLATKGYLPASDSGRGVCRLADWF
jgi:hypothetical protein